MLNKSGLVWLQVKGGLGSESWKEGVVGSGTGLLEALMPEESFACNGLGIKQEDRAQGADGSTLSVTQPESRWLGNPAGTHCLRVEEGVTLAADVAFVGEGRVGF